MVFHGLGGAGAVAAPFRAVKLGGQVPTRENLEMLKLVQSKPKDFNPMMLLDHTEPKLTVDSVLDGLGFDNAEYSTWRKFLQKAFDSDNEVILRKDLISKMMADRLNPQLRRALLQRAVVHYRGKMQKSKTMVDVITMDEVKLLTQVEACAKKHGLVIDDLRKAATGGEKRTYNVEGHPEVIEQLDKLLLTMNKLGSWGASRELVLSMDGDGPHWLKVDGVNGKLEKLDTDKDSIAMYSLKLKKADARGGTYHRRVPRASGKGYTYYYDPDKYNRSSNAHIEGATAAKSQIQKGVQKLLDGDTEGKGVELKAIKAIVKRYGAKACSDAIKEMDNVTFKKGKLSLRKSEYFVLGR